MNIAIIGNDVAFMEVKAKLGDSHKYFHEETVTQRILSYSLDVVFDFTADWSAKHIEVYIQIAVPIFINTVFTTLASVIQKIKTQGLIYGFCGLPTFFNRSQLEIVSRESDRKPLSNILTELNLDYTLVKDQVGMVTPRVVCMIINEAYEALQQGVASRQDIDLSMRLGTNYPYGPFEWGNRIGLDYLRNLMISLKDSTKDSKFNPNF